MLTVHPHSHHMTASEQVGREAGYRVLRVLVVDDHPAVRTGVLALLEEQPDLVVIDAVGSAEAAMSL
ncbi:MAG: hypothetical protein ACLPZR_28965, partial [Solirubrobacteraceae bacterium]